MKEDDGGSLAVAPGTPKQRFTELSQFSLKRMGQALRCDLHGGEGTAPTDQTWSFPGRRGLFEVPFVQAQDGTSSAAERMEV
jgi:hypothetical protein